MSIPVLKSSFAVNSGHSRAETGDDGVRTIVSHAVPTIVLRPDPTHRYARERVGSGHETICPRLKGVACETD